MTLHETKLKSLKNVLVGCLGYDWDELDNYDMTQPDDMDESGSGGAWDLAGAIADNVLDELYNQDSVDDMLYQRIKDNLQSLLYNLLCEYKDEQEPNE